MLLWRTHSCVKRRVHSTRGEYTRSGRREESRRCTQECVRHVCQFANVKLFLRWSLGMRYCEAVVAREACSALRFRHTHRKFVAMLRHIDVALPITFASM